MNETMKMSLAVDWFAVAGRGTIKSVYPFQAKKRDYSCKEFAELWDVTYYDKPFCSVSTKPYLPSLQETFVLIKFENSWLYDKNFAEAYHRFIRTLDITDLKLSRLDLAGDFNLFIGAYNPHQLIADFMEGNIVPNNKMGVRVHLGAGKRYEFEYLEFGSRKSAIRTYLYNKTKEMQDVKFKPWIAQSWVENGLNTETPVWRLEFSMKDGAFGMVDKETGEAYQLTPEDIFDNGVLTRFYEFMYNKYFSFKVPNEQKNKSRWPNKDLFGTPRILVARIYPECKEDVGRAERIFSARLIKEVLGDSFLYAADRTAVTMWARDWVQRRKLESYLAHRDLALSL